jgi:fluoroacetyl-CoA thioesterase
MGGEHIMANLQAGLKGQKEMVVEDQHLASFMGNMGADVLSTHYVLLLLELAARNAIEGRLPEGMMTVGTWVKIRHLAATPLGLRVRAEATLKEIQGRRLFFDVAAYDEYEKIAEGENEQMVVSINRFLGRVKEKKLEPRIELA